MPLAASAKRSAAHRGGRRFASGLDWAGSFLVLLTPAIPVATWMACFHYQGSIVTMIEAGPSGWWQHVPVPTLTAVKILLGWIVAQALLLKLLPGPTIRGPITPTGAQPLYRRNGIPAWIVTHGGIFGIAWPMGWLDPGSLYEHYGALLALLVITRWSSACSFTGRDAVIQAVVMRSILVSPCSISFRASNCIRSSWVST